MSGKETRLTRDDALGDALRRIRVLERLISSPGVPVEIAVVSVAMDINDTFGTGGGAMTIDYDPFSLVSIASNDISVLEPGEYFIDLRAFFDDFSPFSSVASTVVFANLTRTGTPTLVRARLSDQYAMRIKEVGVNTYTFSCNEGLVVDLQPGDLPFSVKPFTSFENGSALGLGGTHNVTVTFTRLSDPT